MPAFVSPLADASTWNYSITEVTLPAGLRYGGQTVRGVRAQNAGGANALMPMRGLLRRATGADGREYVEIQTDPFWIRRVVLSLAGGLPVFYMVFPDAVGLSVANDQIAPDGEVLRETAMDVTIAAVFQDRVTRDPALWASQILAAMNGAGENATLWQPFADALNTQTNSGNLAPVLLLDHAGQPQRTGFVDVVIDGGPARSISLDPADLGDLQHAVTRINPADPGLWSGAASFVIRPARAGGEEVQLALLENSSRAVNEIVVTPAQRHVLTTKATSWFAPQYAVPTGQPGSPLARYTRGNKVTSLINGPEYFDDLFRRLQEARVPDGRFDLAGWAMFPQTEFTKVRDGEPADLPLTLEQAAQLIAEADGSCRFLPARFVQLEPGASSVTQGEIMAFHLIFSGILVANAFGLQAVRTDPAGIVILMGLVFANAVLVSTLFSNGGELLEPNRDAVDILDAIANAGCILSPYPATIDDNTALSNPLSGFPFTTLFQVIRQFGIYHQKFAIVRTATNHFGYCGGIDLNPDRLDDANHLIKFPYHDLHAKLEGAAVRDLAISFAQRWERDGVGDVLPFDPPDTATLGTPGTDIVQVARTYFEPHDSSRAFSFAPQGDRTIADTMIAAIEQAREFIYIEDQYLTPPLEYRNAVLAKVSGGEIRKLIIAVPVLTDQLFGVLARSQFVSDLRTADAGRGIVLVGYPRRRYTVPDNDLRASSGRCVLAEAMPAAPGLNPTVVLKPQARVPGPPFWLSVDGEIMWVYDESTDAAPAGTKRLKVNRGADTKLVRGGASPAGTSTREHNVGAPATVIDLSNIYVHAKMMICDDVFLGVGSANLNRRGLFHDGEINIFTMPEALRATPNNPIMALRRRLWAEMLDLPAEMAAPLLEDPVAAAKLFERSSFFGNRFVDIDAYPTNLMFGATTGDALVATLLQGFVFGIGAVNTTRLFDGVVDPSSAAETP